MRYRLSFELNTDTDPSQLLELLTELAESMAHEVEDESTEDASGEPVDVPATVTEEAVEVLNAGPDLSTMAGRKAKWRRFALGGE